MLTWLIVVIIISSLPIGYLLSYLCKDELVSGRKWFIILGILSLVASLLVAFFSFSSKLAVILTLFYLAIISFVSVWKSYDSRFIKN